MITIKRITIAFALFAASLPIVIYADTLNGDSVVNGNLTINDQGSQQNSLNIRGRYPSVYQSGTNYFKGIDVQQSDYIIPDGVTDGGYRIGLAIHGFVGTGNFSGTLNSQFGAWIRAGHNNHYSHGNPTGHINTIYGLYLENLDSSSVSVDDHFGLFQSNSNVKNYFGGSLGLGTASPKSALHVGKLNQEIRFDYNNTDSYYGSLRWAGLQLGNNGANRVVAGRTNAGGNFEFWVNNTNDAANYQQSPDGTMALKLDASGNVGIGTLTPGNKLDVDGTIRAKEVIVETNWPDYVFEEGYRLRTLADVERHIAEYGHLPGVPSADEIAAAGVSLGDSQRILLEKIEELTLYAIEKDKEVAALRERNGTLEARMARVERLLTQAAK